MQKPLTSPLVSTLAQQQPHHSNAVLTALGVGRNVLSTSEYSSSSTRRTATQINHDLDAIDTIQQKYRGELGAAASRRVEGMIAETFIKSAYGLTIQQYETLQTYDLPILHVSKYNWSLFDHHSPESLRQKYPELFL